MYIKKLSPSAWPVAFLALLSLWGCQKEELSPVPPPKENIVTPPPALRTKRLYVVLGSSTAEGIGAGSYDSSWVGRCRAYLRSKEVTRHDSIINLGTSGYSTKEILPAGDANRNITKALAYNPYAIIVNMPSNDIAAGRSVEDQMKNFATIAALAEAQKVVFWVTTSQPRDFGPDGLRKLMELRDQITAVYGQHSIDFWTGLANPDGSINASYGVGDGTHLNHNGHRILFSRVVEKKVFAN